MAAAASTPESRRERTLVLALVVALVAAVLALYWPVRTHGFVSYDDEVYLTQNPHVARGLDWGEAWWLTTHDYAANYHPLTWLSHMLDVELFGLEPGPHHLVNVALHALNAVLVFFLARALLERVWPAALAAALFALHPLRVESVAWASERKDVLCATFFVAALLAYLRYARAPSSGRYLLVCVLFVLALLAKPMAVTLPCVLLLLDVWPLQRWGVRSPTCSFVQGAPSLAPTRPGEAATRPPRGAGGFTLFREKIPLFVLAAAGAASTWIAQEVGGTTSTAQAVPLDLRLLNALATFGVYLRETFWPAQLAVFHPLAAVIHPDDPRAALLVPALVSGFVVLALSVLAWRLRARWPWFLVGWLWFLGTLVPVIGIKQVGAQAHADRYTYLPLIGIAWILAGCAGELARGRAALRAAGGALSAAALLALFCVARTQLDTWQDTRTLFEHALDVSTDNYVAHAALGAYDLEHGQRDAARKHLEQALQIYPLDATALTSLGRLELEGGELQAAGEHLLRAKQICATKWVRYQLGQLALRLNDFARAVREFGAALELDPSFVDARYNLGQSLYNLHRKDEARASFEQTLALTPEHAGATVGLGVLALDAGDLAQAEHLFTRATELDPGYADAFNDLGVVLERQGRKAEARARYDEARRLEAAAKAPH